MKILFVGSTHLHSTSVHYYTNLRLQGHEVTPWNPGFFAERNALGRIILRLNRGPTKLKIARINRALVRQCEAARYDLVFVMGENYITPKAIEAVRALTPNPPRFLFHSHDNLFAPGILKNVGFEKHLAAFDIVFTTKSQNVARYQALGQKNAHYIPSAFEPTVHKPTAAGTGLARSKPHVGFIGTYDKSRIPWLEKVGWDRLRVWGNGWERYRYYKKHQVRIHPWAIYSTQFAQVCSQTLCSLGLLREEAEDRHTQRTFEIPACGSLQFAPRNDEIAGFFEDQKEIILFSSPEELQDKLDYYLAHPAQREKIAAAGHARCLSGGHSYGDRTREMLKLI